MNGCKKVQTLGLFVNPMKDESRLLVPDVAAACLSAGITLLAEPAVTMATPTSAMTIDQMVQASDALLVLGGDGTILRAISCMHGDFKPVLGVNLGTLGFLAECMPKDIFASVARLAEGDYSLEQRMLMHARLEGDDTVHTALNDVVVTRGSFSRMINADIYVRDMLAARYEGDGTVIASPTGSTAYSLSAGGPIVEPCMDCFVLAPICPHTLSSRPLVVSAGSRLRLELTPRGEDGGMLLSVDGLQCAILHNKAALHIRRSEKTLPFVRFDGDCFFELLRNKLSKWGGAMQLDEPSEPRR